MPQQRLRWCSTARPADLGGMEEERRRLRTEAARRLDIFTIGNSRAATVFNKFLSIFRKNLILTRKSTKEGVLCSAHDSALSFISKGCCRCRMVFGHKVFPLQTPRGQEGGIFSSFFSSSINEKGKYDRFIRSGSFIVRITISILR